jgi:hypothetical protein
MTPYRIVRVAVVASACAVLATRAVAQPAVARSPEKKIQATTPEPKGDVVSQGFSVVLVLGDSQLTTIAENVPLAARRALADMKDFLPYKGYRLLDAQWILGSQRSVSRLRGPEDQEYQLTLRTVSLGPRLQVTFQLQEPGAQLMTARELDEATQRRAEESELRSKLERQQKEAAVLRDRLGEKNATVAGAYAEIEGTRQRIAQAEGVSVARGRSVIDTSFSMEIGETVVVGTSRMRGGDKALIALLTAVPRNTTKKE